jgi:protein involved in polysaccharide export with SLBB domain/Tfp pilus assembly protein PilF
MKKVISVALFAFFSLSAIGSVFAQQRSAKKKPKTATSERKNSGATASLSTNSPAEANSLSKPDSTVDPGNDAQKHYDSAVALSEAGRFEEAIGAFKQSLKLKPDDPQTNFTLGMTYSKSKSYQEAFESFKRAVRLKPDWPEAHFRLGMTSYVLGKRTQSLSEYKKLLELKSPFANVLYRIIQEEDGPAAGTERANTTETISLVRPPEEIPSASPVSMEKDQNSATAVVEPSPNSPGAGRETVSGQQPLTEIYRVGVGDVLDIRFLNSATSRSTLFTVIGGGLIDLPVAGGPMVVGGLTANEIQNRLAVELKRRAVDEGARVSVSVRQYASHSIVIRGLVVNPGTRFLRREAVPLYVVLSESQLNNDAGRVMIMRAGTPGQSLDLNDPLTLNTSVLPGDVITVTNRPQEFYYIAGRINYPGQKVFQTGITLMQAILAAGGTARENDTIVEVSREGSGGRLITTKFNLKEIKSGGVEDPKLQAGDRIQVVR